MREIKFETGAGEAQVWADLFRSFAAGETFLTGSKQVIHAAVKVYAALEATSVSDGAGGQIRLNPAGAIVRLEDAHYDVLRDAVDATLERGLNGVRPLDARRAAAVLDRVRDAG